jgi:hypothetical protein
MLAPTSAMKINGRIQSRPMLRGLSRPPVLQILKARIRRIRGRMT